ncbi:MAG: hydantoinase/oxoprolinase family protein [Pseudomonadota bacterium]
MSAPKPTLRIGIDVGGTFTDVVAEDTSSGQVETFKVRSTPRAPADAVLSGLAMVLEAFGVPGAAVSFFGHGTTIVTNMAIERVGARIALVTTTGFRDVLALGRQARPHVYDYRVTRPEPLAPRSRRLEVRERIGPDGAVIAPLSRDDLDRAVEALLAAQVDAVAVCFLHAYANPCHEQQAAERIAEALPGVFVCASHAVAGEHREFERFATTALNAFVAPRAGRYFAELSKGIKQQGVGAQLYTVTSSGALMDAASVCAVPVRTSLSGPAAGVSGIARILGDVPPDNLVTFDVGGTSTDIAVLEAGAVRVTQHREVAGHPILAPTADIEVIGAGGGSIASVDAGGALQVGPQSAGAEPGPAAYGHGGTLATLTDAAVVLGRIGGDVPLGGRVVLDPQAAREAVERHVAQPLSMTLEEAAAGIMEVAVANISRTIRSAVTARGADAADFALVGYGGMGPLLAADVAEALGMARVIIPASPGTLCARALLVSDIAREDAHTSPRLLDEAGLDAVRREEANLREEGAEWLTGEGIVAQAQQCAVRLDARYRGQGFELSIPLLSEDTLACVHRRFHQTHAREQGFQLGEREIEAVTVRVRSFASPAVGPPVPSPGMDGHEPGTRRVSAGGQGVTVPVIPRACVAPTLPGPAIIEEATATTFVPEGWQARVLDQGTLTLERSP